MARLRKGRSAGSASVDDVNRNLRQLAFRPLRVEDEQAFSRAVEEFRHSDPDFEFALGLEEGMSFEAYMRRLDAWSRGEDLPERFVRGSFYVGVVEGKIVGRVSIRHELNAHLAAVGGHVGYGVVASERRRGYATDMLRRALAICARDLGLGRVLVTCDEDNVGSRKVIERCGGAWDGWASEPGKMKRKCRYWVSTDPEERK